MQQEQRLADPGAGRVGLGSEGLDEGGRARPVDDGGRDDDPADDGREALGQRAVVAEHIAAVSRRR